MDSVPTAPAPATAFGMPMKRLSTPPAVPAPFLLYDGPLTAGASAGAAPRPGRPPSARRSIRGCGRGVVAALAHGREAVVASASLSAHPGSAGPFSERRT